MTDNNNLCHHTTTQIGDVVSRLEKMLERMEGKMVAGQEKTETQLRELKTGQESINRIAIAFTVAAVVLQGDFIKPLLASFFKQLF
jgi:flagellar hook-basal body complex protein FliE